MPIVPELLASFRKQVHRNADAVIRSGKFNHWERLDIHVPSELDAPEVLAQSEITLTRLPQTWEAQAQVFAGHVVRDGWTRREIPREFHEEVSRLVSAVR